MVCNELWREGKLEGSHVGFGRSWRRARKEEGGAMRVGRFSTSRKFAAKSPRQAVFLSHFRTRYL